VPAKGRLRNFDEVVCDDGEDREGAQRVGDRGSIGVRSRANIGRSRRA